MAELPADLAPRIGPDGLTVDSPAMAYTEKVLEEKELQLKKVIQDNYSKIRNVEKELASLAFEIKLTAGPKKAALEHLRKKIEVSGEKIKAAKQKEEQTRKIWEAAAKVLKEEEDSKEKLCEDLNRLVQENAAFQYARLEDLKKRLEAFNPDLTGCVIRPNSVEHEGDSTAPSHKPGANLKNSSSELMVEPKNQNGGTTGKETHCAAPTTDPCGTSKSVHGVIDEGLLKVVASEKAARSDGSQRHPSLLRPGNQVKGRNSLVKGLPAGQGLGPKGNSWTGAGFDVDDASTH